MAECADVWAVGPVCHVIDEAVELPRPIATRGQRGLWPLSLAARLEVLRQLPEAARHRFEKGSGEDIRKEAQIST